jgi:alpha-glucosidase (family GH31 glycosyl hydrolase)
VEDEQLVNIVKIMRESNIALDFIVKDFGAWMGSRYARVRSAPWCEISSLAL